MSDGTSLNSLNSKANAAPYVPGGRGTPGPLPLPVHLPLPVPVHLTGSASATFTPEAVNAAVFIPGGT